MVTRNEAPVSRGSSATVESPEITAEEKRTYGIEVRAGGSKKASNVPSHKKSTVYVRSLSSVRRFQASKPRSWLRVGPIGI